MEKWLKPAGAIVLAIIVAGSYVYSIPVEILQKYGFLIFFGIFCAYIAWYIHSLNEDIKKLGSQKPSITVNPQTYFDNYYLTVNNNGEKATFTAEISLLYSSTGAITHDINGVAVNYTALWSKTNTNSTEIMKGQHDNIKIASVEITKVSTRLALWAYDVANKSSYMVRSASWTPTIKNVIVPEFWLKVIISSDPSLKDGAFTQNYVVNLSNIDVKKLPKTWVQDWDSKTVFSEFDNRDTIDG